MAITQDSESCNPSSNLGEACIGVRPTLFCFSPFLTYNNDMFHEGGSLVLLGFMVTQSV